MPDNYATLQVRPFVLVLGLDLTEQESSGYAFDQAVHIASRIDHSEVHVVHVVANDVSPERTREAAELLQLYVAEKAAALSIRGPRRAGVHTQAGDPAKEIAQLAADVGADMIVVGARRAHHVSGLWLGSTAARVMAATTCPVFVAGPRPKPQPSHVIVIEPPCPDCVERRFATRGRSWWCDRHSENHHMRRHHVYSYEGDFPFAGHDSAVTPTGVD